jgi:hypothetical protein
MIFSDSMSKIKLACDVGKQNSLERITYSIAVERLGFPHGLGPSRHFAAMQRFSRTWSEADINWKAKPADSVENDVVDDARSRHRMCQKGIVEQRITGGGRPYAG